MQHQAIKEQTKGIRGTVRVRRYRAGTLELAEPYYRQARIAQRIAGECNDGSPGLAGYLLERAAAHKAKAQEILDAGYLGLALEQRNLIVSGTGGYGKNIIARVLGSDNTYSLNIGYGEIGTGSTTPTLADTALTTPTVRVAVTSADVSDNIVTLRFFYSDAALANGTYYEFGTFCGGSITIGTGQMFNHALFSAAYSKATGQDTSVDVEIDIN